MATGQDAVLFDIDGTLVDSTYHHAVAWQRAFKRQDLTLPLWRLHRAIGMGGEKLVAHVAGESVERECGDALRDGWREEYLPLRDEVAPLPGAEQVVRSLVEGGYVVALASSGDPQFAGEAVDLLDISDQIETMTTSEDVDASKPEPDLVSETLGRLPDVSRAVFVGDTPYDVEAAERAGLGCVALRSGGFSEAELRAAGALAVYDVPGDLLDLDWRNLLRAAH